MPFKTWSDRAREMIHSVTKDLATETTLKDRSRIIRDACPSSWRQCSWPQKAWQKARREYLVKFGYIPKTKPKKRKGGTDCPGPGGLLDLMTKEGQ